MGFLDFLNPKKTIEKKLSRAVEQEIGPELINLKNELDPARRHTLLTRLVEAKIQSKAAETIPAAMQKHSQPIIQNVSQNLVAKLNEQLSC